jgi:hypothetical protein
MAIVRVPQRLLCALVLLLFGFCGVGITPALAHDAVVGGSPADGSTIHQSPKEIVLEFSGEPKEGFNTIAITDQNGAVVHRGEPRVDGRNLILDLPADFSLQPGDYTIGFQITSSDGHATRGKTSFSLAGDAAQSSESVVVTQSETIMPPTGEEENSFSITTPNTWAKVGVVAGVLVLFMVLAVLFVRRRTGSR